MARKTRRGTGRPAGASKPTSIALQELLKALTPEPPAAAAPTPIPADQPWGWVLAIHQGGFSVRPAWLQAADGPFQPASGLPKWQGHPWTPVREGGWREDEHAELTAVSAGQSLEQGWWPLRHLTQWAQLWRSVAQGRPLAMHAPDGWHPVVLGEAEPADLAWHEAPEGGLGMAPAGDRPWAMVEHHAFAVTAPVSERSAEDATEAPGSTALAPLVLHPLQADARLLRWALRHGQLSAEEVAQWQTRHAHDERLAPVPLPAHLSPQTVEDEPQLLARIVARGDEATAHLGLQLMVRYGDHVLPLHGPDTVTLEVEGRPLQIKRKRGQERRQMNALTGQGLRLWPHPFSKNDSFPLGWPMAWMADAHQANARWLAPEPLPTSLNEWFALARRLEAEGVAVAWDAKIPFLRAPSQQLWTTQVTEASKGRQRWLEAGIGVDIDGEQVDLTAALLALAQDPAFPLKPSAHEAPDAVWALTVPNRSPLTYLDVPLARLRALLAPLLATEPDAGATRVKLPTTALGEVAAWPTAVQMAPNLEALWDLVHTPPEPTPLPEQFLATLYPYQEAGVAWLDQLARAGWGGILADDMGLGKTVQVLAHLSKQLLVPRATRHPYLIVVPTSLLGNWTAEVAKFAPHLRLTTYYGQQREALVAHIQAGDTDVVLTTYGVLLRDTDTLAGMAFEAAFFDEAQALKNPRSQLAKAVRRVPTERRISLSGTPLENHLGELWALMDLAMPGLLGSKEAFRTRFQTPIERGKDAQALARLRARMAPFLLRRLKSEVAQDLPPKTEMVVRLAMPENQRALYESMRAQQHALIQQASSEAHQGKQTMVVLNALLRLRQVCCDPALLGEVGQGVESVKREHLMQHLEALLEEGRQVLLVSQFTHMLELLSADLTARGVTHEVLTGQTDPTQRMACVDRFQAGQSPLFLVSLKAGGVGLNLTAADTVIHYDPWWNPAAENQATDRIYRLGQDKPTFVYRLVCQGTVEERILDLQADKSQLADAVLDGMGQGMSRLSEADLDALFAPLG